MAQQFDVHPNQITQLKGQLLEGAAGVFGQDKSEAGASGVDLKDLGGGGSLSIWIDASCEPKIEPNRMTDGLGARSDDGLSRSNH